MYYDYMLPLKENAIVVEHNSKTLVSATTTASAKDQHDSARAVTLCSCTEEITKGDAHQNIKNSIVAKFARRSRKVVCYAARRAELKLQSI